MKLYADQEDSEVWVDSAEGVYTECDSEIIYEADSVDYEWFDKHQALVLLEGIEEYMIYQVGPLADTENIYDIDPQELANHINYFITYNLGRRKVYGVTNIKELKVEVIR